MPDQKRPESADLTDYEVLDSGDTLDGAPGDDPLDRGIIPPEHWTAASRYGTTAGEEADGESLDQLLAEEEPDLTEDEDEDEDDSPEDADDDPAPRSGRLIAPDGGHHTRRQARLLAHDVGPDGGGATAEEVAMHTTDELALQRTPADQRTGCD
jgi:hypothetical protein